MHIAKVPRILQPFECKDLNRIGKHNDGGYLVNAQDVLKTKLLLSFGIGTDCSFEEHFSNLGFCSVFAYDEQAKVNNFLRNDKQRLFYKNIGLVDSDTEVDIHSLLAAHDNIFVKCDIDGGEYQLFDAFINNSNKLCGLVIEVHDIHKNENFDKVVNFISKIGLKLVHTHVNNYFYYKTSNGNVPDILELTFTSSTNIKYNSSLELPCILDMPNNPNDEEFKLVF